MGQEILYCSKCQTQLRSADFDKQKAYRLHNSVFCLKCARDSVHALPPATIQQLLGQIARQEESAEKRNSSTSRILRAVEIRPAKPLSPRIAPGPGSWGAAGLITLGILAGLALLAALIVSGSSEPKIAHRGAASPVATSPVAAPAAPPAGPSPGTEVPASRPAPPAPPAEPAGTFDAEAAESLRRAREFARANPGDLVGQIALFETAAWESSGTPLQGPAQRDLEALKTKDRSLALQELPGMLGPARAAALKEEFGSALALLERGRKRHAVSEWTGPVEKAVKEIREQANGLYGPLKEKALGFSRAGNSGELQAIRSRIAKWNLEELRTDFERELARSVPPQNPGPSPVTPPVTPPVTSPAAPSGETARVQAPRTPDQDPGPIGYWKFDEGKGPLASDSSRNRNHATLMNGAAWTAGKFGGGMSFSGTDAHLLAPATPSLADLGPLTVSAWVKPGKLKLGRIVAKEGAGRGRWMFIAGESTIAFAKDFSVQELRRETVANLLPSGEWHHLAVTWDGTAQVTQVHIFVDGVEAAYAKNQDGTGQKMSDALTPLSIGNRGDLSRGFQGTIDEVRIYARALTPQEISGLSTAKPK